MASYTPFSLSENRKYVYFCLGVLPIRWALHCQDMKCSPYAKKHPVRLLEYVCIAGFKIWNGSIFLNIFDITCACNCFCNCLRYCLSIKTDAIVKFWRGFVFMQWPRIIKHRHMYNAPRRCYWCWRTVKIRQSRYFRQNRYFLKFRQITT